MGVKRGGLLASRRDNREWASRASCLGQNREEWMTDTIDVYFLCFLEWVVEDLASLVRRKFDGSCLRLVLVL